MNVISWPTGHLTGQSNSGTILMGGNQVSWNELAEKIKQLTPEQRATDVTYYSDDCFHRPTSFEFTDADDDTLDENHPFLS